jgi:hypothetical protein
MGDRNPGRETPDFMWVMAMCFTGGRSRNRKELLHYLGEGHESIQVRCQGMPEHCGKWSIFGDLTESCVESGSVFEDI